SLHAAPSASGVWEQPLLGSQASLVQGFPSSQPPGHGESMQHITPLCDGMRRQPVVLVEASWRLLAMQVYFEPLLPSSSPGQEAPMPAMSESLVMLLIWQPPPAP